MKNIQSKFEIAVLEEKINKIKLQGQVHKYEAVFGCFVDI